MNIYLIMPVRLATKESDDIATKYVAKLEAEGNHVHFPPRDVDQTDDGCGLRICKAHRNAMFSADEVHVLWDSDSKGSHFDLGMAFIVQLINPFLKFRLVKVPEKTLTKSYTNVLLAISDKDD